MMKFEKSQNSNNERRGNMKFHKNRNIISRRKRKLQQRKNALKET